MSGKWLHAFVISLLEVLGVFEAFEPSHWKMTWRYGPGRRRAQTQLFCWDSCWKAVPSFEELRFLLFSTVSQLLQWCKTASTEVCNYTLLGSAFGKFQRHLHRLKVKLLLSIAHGFFFLRKHSVESLLQKCYKHRLWKDQWEELSLRNFKQKNALTCIHF